MKLKYYIASLLLIFISCGSSSLLAQNGNFLDAVKEYNLGNLVKAKEFFIKSLEEDHSNGASYFYLSKISAENNDIVSAEALIKKAIELDTLNFYYNELLAKIYINSSKTKEAISVYEDLINKYPKKMELYYVLCNLYISKQDTDSANKILDKIQKISGKSEPLALTKMNLFRMENNWEGALKYLVEFTSDFPSAKIETLIGDMYVDRFKDSLALIYYTKALSHDPDYSPAKYGKAEMYRLKGDFDKYFKLITPFFADSNIEVALKEAYLKQLMMSGAFVQKYRQNVDSLVYKMELAHPNDSLALVTAATYYAQGGDKERALKILRSNYSMHPDKFGTTFQYLTYLYFLKEWEELERESAKSLTIFNDNTDILQLLGISQFQLKNPGESINTYKTIEKIALRTKDTVNLVQAYSLIGDMSYELGNQSQSYKYYKKALKLDPNNLPVLNNYAYYLSLEGKNLKLAYQMSMRAIEKEPDNPTYLDTFGWILFLMDKPLEAKSQFKHAMLYGGKESAAVLDHYAEVLFALKEYDLAFIYWEQAKALDKTLQIDKKIIERKKQMQK